MSDNQVRILNLEARLHLSESRQRALTILVVKALQDLGLKQTNGVSPETYIQQKSESILQETLRGLADHDPIHANQLAAFLADIKTASQKDTP